MRPTACIALAMFTFLACDQINGTNVWEKPCTDMSWLLATTAGSPNQAACPNKSHRMRVQVATTPSQEEIGALVFCECQRDGGQ